MQPVDFIKFGAIIALSLAMHIQLLGGWQKTLNLHIGFNNDVRFLLHAEIDLVFVFKSLLYEIIAGLQTVGTDVGSSSSAPPSISTTKSVGDSLPDIAPVTSVIL